MLLLGGRTQASSRTTFAYTPAAVWRYFLVAHQRYFGEFFPCKSKTYKESHPLRQYKGNLAINSVAGFFFFRRL